MREYVQRAEDLKEMLDGQQTTPDASNGAQAQSARPKGGAPGGGGGGGGNAKEVGGVGVRGRAGLAVLRALLGGPWAELEAIGGGLAAITSMIATTAEVDWWRCMAAWLLQDELEKLRSSLGGAILEERPNVKVWRCPTPALGLWVVVVSGACGRREGCQRR